MEEKKGIKISLLTFFLILSVIVIIVMAYFIYKISNEKTVETEKVANLNNEVSSLQSTVNNLNEKISNVSNIVNDSNTQNSNNLDSNSSITSNSNNSNYIELTESNFNKYYNNEKYLLNIQNAVNNGDGTITLKEEVYEKYIKGDEKELEGEESVAHFKKTGIVMHITLDQNFKCKYESVSETEEKSLKEISEEYKTKSNEEELEEDADIRSVVSDKFVFNNGKCTEIIFYVPR